MFAPRQKFRGRQEQAGDDTIMLFASMWFNVIEIRSNFETIAFHF